VHSPCLKLSSPVEIVMELMICSSL
jgi:hypothetical protein